MLGLSPRAKGNPRGQIKVEDLQGKRIAGSSRHPRNSLWLSGAGIGLGGKANPLINDGFKNFSASLTRFAFTLGVTVAVITQK